MLLSIDWKTKTINVPRDYLTHISGNLYELNTNQFRLDLKNIEDSEEGIMFPDTHIHNSSITVAGVTYARTIEIINGYSITFENGFYSVRLIGSNNNIFDIQNNILNQNYVQVIPTNSAGYITISSGSGLSTDEHNRLMSLPSAENVSNELSKVLNDVSTEELTSMPGEIPSFGKMLRFIYQYFRNKRTVTNNIEKMYKNDEITELGSAILSDDGTTFTKNEML